MPPFTPPRNFGISQRGAILVAVAGAILSATAITITVLIYGVDERTTPVVLPLMGTLGLVILNLAGAIKAAEAADTASKAKNLSELTASQNATIHQALTSHCGEMCPLDNCPLRTEERRILL